ncbi:MAG: hypothetical protein LBQ66_15345 [Planctomycetaceae bacterium]|jgi:hypothetical protein|nr:hypothetical protein [Planctomycetaceae bacterium]
MASVDFVPAEAVQVVRNVVAVNVFHLTKSVAAMVRIAVVVVAGIVKIHTQ